ncbi:unnamed protein product [Discosporangium mesarthrocarpum]
MTSLFGGSFDPLRPPLLSFAQTKYICFHSLCLHIITTSNLLISFQAFQHSLASPSRIFLRLFFSFTLGFMKQVHEGIQLLLHCLILAISGLSLQSAYYPMCAECLFYILCQPV